MQRDDLIYDMYKRRIDSGLTYGQGIYGSGVSGGSYCTGDALQYNPMHPIGMHMTDRRFMPRQVIPPFYGSGANAWTDFVKKHKGSGKDMKQLSKLWKKHKAALNKKPNKAANSSEYRKFMKKAKADNPDKSYRDLDCLWFSSKNKHSKNPKTRARCGFNAAQVIEPVAEPVKENSYEKFRLYALASIHPTPTEEEIRDIYEYGIKGNKQ